MLLQKNTELRRELETALKQVKQLEKVRLAYCYIFTFRSFGIVSFVVVRSKRLIFLFDLAV